MACSNGPEPERKPNWPAEFHWLERRPTTAHTRDTLVDFGMGNLEQRVPAQIHSLFFVAHDTLEVRLWEFSQDYWAYFLFQRNAPPDAELDKGVYRKGPSLLFHLGHFLGEVHYSHHALVPQAYLQESLKDFELGRLPEVFRAFPRLHRVAGSERVHLGQPMGFSWETPAFSVAYPCQIDTAQIIRLPGKAAQARLAEMTRYWQGQVDTLSWGREMRFQGWTDMGVPVLFYASSAGLVGVEGCSDTARAAEYVEIIKKMDVLLPKP